MAFTCFECHLGSLLDLTEFKATLLVARDATLEGRREDAVKVWRQAQDLVRAAKDYHTSMYEYGEDIAWPGEIVWKPSLGVSVGPCEDCSRSRPCVNV